MSLDFVIAKSKSDATRTAPSLSISEGEHHSLASLFSVGSHPVLSRVSNFYSDAAFQGDDIDVLTNEVFTLKTDSPTVGKLKDICDAAKKQSKNIYVFCD